MRCQRNKVLQAIWNVRKGRYRYTWDTGQGGIGQRLDGVNSCQDRTISRIKLGCELVDLAGVYTHYTGNRCWSRRYQVGKVYLCDCVLGVNMYTCDSGGLCKVILGGDG